MVWTKIITTKIVAFAVNKPLDWVCQFFSADKWKVIAPEMSCGLYEKYYGLQELMFLCLKHEAEKMLINPFISS